MTKRIISFSLWLILHAMLHHLASDNTFDRLRISGEVEIREGGGGGGRQFASAPCSQCGVRYHITGVTFRCVGILRASAASQD